jgi:hypothetical protein
MPSLPPGLEPYRGLLIFLAVVLIALLAIPASRRALRNLREQCSGCLDGLLVSNRPIKAARAAVEHKSAGLAARAKTRFQDWMVKYHERSTKEVLTLQVAERTHEDAIAALARAQQEAEDDAREGNPEKLAPSRSPFSLNSYYAMQLVLGIGDIVFTYFAFELWKLPTLLLVPLVILLGLLGVVLGHLCGQAIAKNNQSFAIATGIGAAVQCIILGATRFAYLLYQNQSQASQVDTISAIAAFGIPFLLVFTSTVLGAQVRYPTELEKARAMESAAEQWRDTTFARGALAAKRLLARMESRRLRMLEIVETYYRGFGFGWRNEPLDFSLPNIEVPEPLWPPPSARQNATSQAGAS